MSIRMPFEYKRRASGDPDSACAYCGKPVTERHMAHVVNGGNAWGGPGDTTDPGDMGWFPVGPDCAKKLRKAGVYLEECSK